MQKANDNQEFNHNDPTWSLLAEYWLNEATFDHFISVESTTGALFQVIQDLGVPPDSLKGIERAITENARGTKRPFNHCLKEPPVCIRLYSDQKTKASPHQSGDPMKGGWGYYVIERGADFLDNPCQGSYRVMELYLYREGE